jgi:hypothetical protein
VGPLRHALLLGLAVTVLQSCVLPDRYDRRRVTCRGDHRLRVVDLDMSPDPVGEGQRIRSWRVRLRADASGECDTTIRVRESSSNEVVGLERAYHLKPGINVIEVDASRRYRFTRDEHCFEVFADIAQTKRRVDASRRFCAKRTASRRWSMR